MDNIDSSSDVYPGLLSFVEDMRLEGDSLEII